MGLMATLAFGLLFAGSVQATGAFWLDGEKETFNGIPAQDYTAYHIRKLGAEKVYALHLPETLRDLNLSSNGLMILPDNFVPKTIERLWLADNILTDLPNDASDWSALTYLNLDRNRLSSLPDLSKTKLRWLRLNDNRLTTLPALPDTLESLQLQRNGLTTFKLRPRALRHLNLSGNPITDIDVSLGNGLEWLDLSQTKVSRLPDDLSQWRSLKVLNLAECPLSEAEKDRIEASFNPSHTTILF